MAVKTGAREFLWALAGGVIFLIGMLLVLRFQVENNPANGIVLRSARAEIVLRMLLKLTAASEAEKSSVMAVTDRDSKIYADQARAADSDVERGRRELGGLLASGGTAVEKELYNKFTESFAELQVIDNQLLDLAVKNTNIKAYSLAFGPAADALKDMDTNLSAVVTKSAGTPDSEKTVLFVFGAQTSALRIQTLLAPHIAEESDAKMDALEAQMSKEDALVRNDLAGLTSIDKLTNDAGLKKAEFDYEKFSVIRRQILALSRENTNIRSLALSLGQKRKVLLENQDILLQLQQAIHDEPIPAAVNGPESNPRDLGMDAAKPK
jgi:hypothetical protein